ncbi:hypothetical protein JCM30237_12310 [Halolamina litorea]|uniref:Uncharacterized protein n=1 Tax=Halolamina litorea TaxID=1515593 RepID=A0ABD6BN29_9EURY|nr:hypothetical protein [Halolamina litorea]
MPDDQQEPTDESEVETSQEGAPGGGERGGSDQPEIDADEQADVPEGLADIDPEEAEEAAGVDDGDDDPDEEEVEDEPAGAEGEIADPDGSGGTPPDPSPVKAGNLYVSVVQSVTNAQIEKFGDDDAEELGDDHFEQYDLAGHFDATMDYMGVGSDMEPHEALLMATVLSVGDGLVSETDVLDKQVSRLMDKAMNGENGGVAA